MFEQHHAYECPEVYGMEITTSTHPFEGPGIYIYTNVVEVDTKSLVENCHPFKTYVFLQATATCSISHESQAQEKST